MGKYDIDMDLSAKIGCLNAYLNINIFFFFSAQHGRVVGTQGQDSEVTK